jgi:hypothetical protein
LGQFGYRGKTRGRENVEGSINLGDHPADVVDVGQAGWVGTSAPASW